MKDKDRILEKIKKCLALSKSSNAHEAAAALSKAQALMKKYNIDQSAINDSYFDTCQSESIVQSRPPKHTVYLANSIAQAFGVRVVLGYNDQLKPVMQFLGESAGAQVARYCFDVCLRQLTTERKQYIDNLHKNCKPYTKTKRADMFALGWVSAVVQNLPVFELTEEQENALTEYYNRKISQSVRTINGTDRTTKKERSNFSDGVRSGKQFNVNTPVSGTAKQRLLK